MNNGCLAKGEGTTAKISVVGGSIPTWNSENLLLEVFLLYFICFTAMKQIQNNSIVHKLNYDAKNKNSVGNPQNRNELPKQV